MRWLITGYGLYNYGGQEDSSYLTANLHVVWRYLVDVIKVYSQVILGKKYYSSYGTGLDSISWNTIRKREGFPWHPVVKSSGG